MIHALVYDFNIFDGFSKLLRLMIFLKMFLIFFVNQSLNRKMKMSFSLFYSNLYLILRIKTGYLKYLLCLGIGCYLKFHWRDSFKFLLFFYDDWSLSFSQILDDNSYQCFNRNSWYVFLLIIIYFWNYFYDLWFLSKNSMIYLILIL